MYPGLVSSKFKPMICFCEERSQEDMKSSLLVYEVNSSTKKLKLQTKMFFARYELTNDCVNCSSSLHYNYNRLSAKIILQY